MRNTAGERKSNLIKDSASLQIDVDEDKPDAFKLIMCVYKWANKRVSQDLDPAATRSKCPTFPNWAPHVIRFGDAKMAK